MPSCPQGLQKRTAKQTIEEHLALVKAGSLDVAMCDYAEDAVVLLPGQTFVGHEAIQGGLSSFGTLLGGVAPQITSVTATNDVVLVTFTAMGSPCTIPDGADTYIVKKGKIVAQTVHDTFSNAPGAVCPLAASGKK
jgi:ketosteroid isomerase-like protein